MDEEVKKFDQLLKDAENILITSHISPDPDSISAILLLGSALQKNYPDKQIRMITEEEPLGLEFLKGYQAIEFKPLLQALGEQKPDLVILLDANNFTRVSRMDGDNVREFVRRNNVDTVIIDHHEPAGKEVQGLYINQGSPATVQDVYEIGFEKLGLDKPDDYASLTMLGLYADTGGFAYENKRHTQTLKLADELISAGANIEQINNQINQYSNDDIKVFAELAANTAHEEDYTYSYLSDGFVNSWVKGGKSAAQMHKGTEGFVNNFIRNIGGRKWGFIVYKNPLQGDSVYSASFRSVGDAKDVSVLASRLGGGGHKPAAGAKFEADSVQDAIKKVRQAILEP